MTDRNLRSALPIVGGKIDALACNRNQRLRFPIFSFRSRLVFLAVTLAALLVTPALASAATYVVNETNNVTPDVGCQDSGGAECDLWEAIQLANVASDEDTIEFEVSEIDVTEPLPAITQPLRIDGTEPLGGPGVEIVYDSEGFSYGLQIIGNETTIEGLAINAGFNAGVLIEGNDNQICNDYVGTDLSGDAAFENRIGVYVKSSASSGNAIGAGCLLGNVLSGNGWVGILNEGSQTHIANNLIGVGASGAPLPNGEAPEPSQPAGGIIAWGQNALIGGPGEGNTIAYNASPVEFTGFQLGGGVIVESGTTRISGNSIFENEGRGIFFRTPFAFSPPVPKIESVASVEGGSTVVTGSFFGGGEPGEEPEYDVNANAVCDEYVLGEDEIAHAGEGQTYLGSAKATIDLAGEAKFTATLPVQAAGTVLTATTTMQGSGSTSEFSECATAPVPTPKPPTPPNEEPKRPNVVIPTNGETVAVAPKEGTVYVKRPGKGKRKLKEGETIPVGSIIDATQGKVTLTSINAAGEEQTAVFYGGVFLVQQHEGSGLVILKLRGGNFSGCKGEAGTSALARGGRKGRRLWGSGHGKFRTEGNYGSATVRGTIWLTEDRCDGTFFKVKRGVVTIRDFPSNKTFSLPKGKTYFAQP